MNPQAEQRVSLNLRVPSELKRELREYAKRRGIGLNAAASVLLTEALRAARERPS